MNAMNMLISYVFAESSAQKYNVADKQKLQSLALVSGMVSPNPIFAYLIVENEAKKLEVINPVVGESVVIIDDNSNSNCTTSTPIKDESTIIVQNTGPSKEEFYDLIKGATHEALKEDISPNFLRSKNVDEVQLENEILEYSINQQRKSIEKAERDYEFIISHKYFNELPEYDKKTIIEFRETIIEKGILDKFKKVFNNKKFSGNVFFSLVNIFSLYSSNFFSIRYSLEKIELEKKEFHSKEENTVTVDKDSSIKKTTAKK